jgi:DNA-binding NarL/FixJ family response regulator
MRRPRVLLADDHRLLREALSQLLNPSCDIVGTVADGRALLAAATSLKPDVVVVDIAMPLLNGLDAARRLNQLIPEIKVVFLTVNEDPDIAVEALQAGGSGFILKNSAAEELVHAILEVFQGRHYVTPLVKRGMANAAVTAVKRHELGSRQREVLQLLAEGHTMKQIARILNITSRTVAFHKYRIMEELGVKTSAELVQYAIKHHVVSI